MEILNLADRPNAIPVIAAWFFNEWGHKVEGNSVDRTCERLHTRLNRNKVPLLLIATQGNDVLGVGALKLHEMDIYPDKKYWLGDVFVRPESRGNGIAGQLVCRLSEVAESLGIDGLYLYTSDALKGLYATLGWCEQASVTYKGQKVVVMVRSSKLITHDGSGQKTAK